MPLILPVLVLCAGINLARGRSAFALGTIPWRYPAIVLACVAAQVAAVYLSGPPRVVAVVASHAIVTAWLCFQVRVLRAGVRLAVAVLAFGAFLNLIPIVAHGSMPVSTSAVRALHLNRSVDISEGHYGKHVAAKGTDPTTWLGDVIPLRPVRAVISLGDILMALGIGASSLVAVADTRRTMSVGLRALREREHDDGPAPIGDDNAGDFKIAHGAGR
ncbi:MAG: hypothetical protein JWL70_2481 [Acidimicrobiia bacterium]|nr:hypothetical protein [Acidimicrobiia bacterium]